MPNPNDKVKNLYNTFVKDGYAMEPEAQFRENLKDPKKRKAAYDALVKDGYDMEPYAEFESNIGFAKAASAPKRETPSSGQRKPASAVSASSEQPKQQKPKGTPMTEQDKIRMSLQMGQMKQQVQQGIANTNAKIGRMMEPLTQKGRERRRLGEFQARMAGTPTHVVGFNTASPAPAGSGARGGSQQKPVQSEQSPQPYGVKYENGKAKTQWVLPDGTLTTSLIEANQAEYEARTARLAHQFQDRMKENGLDPNKPEDVRKQAQLDYEAPMRKAIEDEWQRAEAEDRAADEAYRKDMERAEGGSFWDRLKKSITPLGPDGMPLRRGDETLRDIKRAAKRQDTFNLEKMAQSVLQNMPQAYKDEQMLNYSRYFREHPSELKGRTVSQAAKEALQGEVYHATYERAVQARMPKSKTEFLLRKVADQPFFSQTMADNMAARLFSHSIGTEAADMDAMGRYGVDHRALDITGTVVNMAIDPTTYISGGVGSIAGKQALKLGGKAMLKGASKEIAERYIGRTLAGRMVAGVAAGSANFGTFEGLKNLQQQMRLGGTLNPETGEYEFSAGDMLKATGHGMLLGSVTGTLSPVLGNVSDKLVKATESTAGKVGIRAGELMTSTVAEGTIFATPEWIENAQLADDDPNKRKAMDIWTDNMAMMLGFKVSHGIKSAPQVIAGLRPIAEPKTIEERNHNRRSFAERLRKRMDASPRDLDFTKEEREELRRNGYGDLASLFTRTSKQPTKPKAKPTMTDGKTMTFDVDFQHAEAERVSNPEFDGYEAMERLMQDPNVSQSARAKAYYILTGRMLPMGTVTGYTTNKDANGVTVQAMTAQGEVVTSRHFKTEEEAKKEEANIMRQAELNSVDVGERYKEAAANAKVVQAAVESVAPGADFAVVMRNYKAVKEGDKDAIAAYGKMVEDIDRAIEANKGVADGERPEAIRASIKEETGVDVDATLRKEPKNRTEEEQAAVEDYIKRLFPEQKSEGAGASAEAEQPMSEEESAAAAAYDQARLLWDKVEKGDADAKAEVDAITLRMQEAYQMCEDAFGADAEMRIAEINEDPWSLVNNPELSEDQQDAVLYYVNAKAAMEGVMDASNEAADGKRKEVEANVERHTHKDMGVVQPATMKVDDKPVYVVKGNVVMLPDGSGIDVRNSDQSIVICDAETGEYKFASPDQLFSLGEAIDPQTELDEAYANIQAEHEAVLGVPENGENVQGNGENVPNSAENVPQLTDEQLQQYAHSAFNEATQSNGITIPQEQAEQLQQHNQQMLEQEQQRKEAEANRQPTALERVPINEETGEPMFEKADRETALDALNEVTGGNDENTTAIVRAQVEQASKALEALKKKEPTKKAPSLKGSPMAMVKAQQEAEANYNTAMEEYNAQVAAAEENLNAWSRINSLMNDRKRAIREQQEAERKAREEKLHAEAVARLKEDKRVAAEKAAEQATVGIHAVNPKIKAKWDGATKVEGNPNAITLADGSTIRGHYVLTEAGAATASHDVNNAYEPTEGFPVDENGESVNDRDYKRDKDAQRIVRDMADSYDSRALQTPVIVSKDGVVLSGNNRTMSGEIAAKQGTDKAYVDHLREFGAMFGFTPEQIDGMQHPRVVFVPDEELPYDANTFARFNAEQQKKQSKPEHAVKLGKIVPDNVFTSITNDISRFDRMSDYYADDKSVASAISQLLDAGVINEMQLPELRTGNALSAAGKELIENTLIGKVFQTSPDAVRQIISTPTLRQSVVMGLNEIANNRTLAKSGYDLSKELAAAVDLVSRAKSDSPEIYKEGMPVSPYGRQKGLFDDEYGDSRVTDGVTLLLADLLNSGKPSDLRKVLSTYNNEAASSAAGQIDMFSGDVTSKEEILKNVNEYFRNATPKEQQALIDAAVAERKRRAEAAEPAGGDEASEQATVVAGSDAEPQQPVVASEEPVKGNEPDADALAKEAEEKLSERITDTEDEWTEPSEYGEIYKHRMFVDGKEVIKVDAPDKSKNYPGTYYEIDGKQFGDLYEVANYIDGNEQPLSAKIEAASAEVNTEPTEAQKEAGNYKKGHVQVGSFDITIEQPQGSVRKGTDADGKQWESKMNNTYGYIRGAVGVDGDHIDVFLSNDIDGWNGRKVFVVDQYNPDGSFDEHKVMLGFNDQDEAKGDYLANYEQGWENGRRIDITGVNLEDFEKWIESSKRKTKPFGEYSSVNKDVVEINTPEAGYSITPSIYTNKKGKTSNVSLLTFDHDLTADQERAVKEFAKERTGEGRFAPARGWKDRESGGWMFRSEEDARKAAEMVGNEEAVADNQPMTAQELRDAVEPKKPTTSKNTAVKKPANRVEVADVAEQKPSEPTKAEQPKQDGEKKLVITDEMKHDEDILRELLGIGDDELDGGIKFRDPDAMTSQQRRFVYNAGVNYSLGYIDQGFVKFPEFAKAMVSRLGYKIKPWLKSFYEGAKRIPGYDQAMFTPTEEVDAFDVENFDKPTKDVMAQANMIVEEGKAQVAAEKANNELKATRNEQRKETEKQTAANTDAVAAEAKSVASEATALAETSSDEQALTGAAERVDETLDKVNEQLALLGYYEADEVEKDYNEAYGYMRNAEKKAVKDAANLASQLIDDLGLDRFEATHGEADKKGKRKTKPLAVANIAPAGGDVSIHLPLAEGRELYVNIQLVPSAGKGITNFGGDNLEVTGIMFRVEHPSGNGNDRYGRNEWVDNDVTYSELLEKVQRETYKYIPARTDVAEGEYNVGDKVQYSPDGGRTWKDAVVAQPNDMGGIRIDTGLAPVMWVNAHPDQLRHKPSEASERKNDAVGDFYEDGINEDAVAALPEDTAIQLHVVDILNPGMTDHSMKSKIESLNTLLPKISDKKLSELDKEYGDDKNMGTHIKAEVARRENEGIFKKAERIAKEDRAKREKARAEAEIDATDLPKPAKDKAKRALHGSDSMTDNAALAEAERRVEKKKKSGKKVKPEQRVGDLFAGLLDEEPETKVEARNDGNTDIHRTFANTVKNDMLASLDNGTKPYRGIIDLRKRAKDLGMDVDDEGRSDILLQELVEDGLVRAAREVTERMGSGNKEAYDLICKLYEMQPTISARSSNRIKMQQYSTPLPMAWNADRFAMHGKDRGQVLEPTAGNGMLVFGVPAKQVHANELDETRLANLREQGFAQVTQQDATEPFEGGKKYDAIISNPPFGKREAAEYDGKMIGGLDPQITLNALASMKDDGRAAIIIGGNMEYAANGGIKNMKPFFTYLYDHYNVKGVVDMDGKLYAKQGTTFPTRMILIDGRRSEEERAQSAVYPPVKTKAVRKADSFEDLYNIIDEIINSPEKTNGTEILRSQQGQLDSVGNKPSRRTDREGHNEQPRENDEAGRREPRTESKPANAANGSQPVLPGERGAAAGDGKAGSKPTGNAEGGTGGNTEPAVQRVGTERVSTDGVGLAPIVHAEPKKRELTDEKSAYRPHNTAYSLKSVAPSAMVEAMDNVLTHIEKEHGSIDNFVTKELGYDSVEDAHHALAAEQMDSVAMAVYQMKHGQALIIGDQTGVGKGRQMAALIRWAVKRGEKPVFITQKADLLSDIYRDLVDVGSGDLVPFIFNSDGAIVDSNGKTVHKPLSQKEQAKVFASGKLPDGYDFAVLTYSQVNTGDDISQKEFREAAKQNGARAKKSKSEGKPTPKATFLRAIAKDNYLFLDESHTAAGTSNTGAYLQSILRSAKAATFASATFAKRPDTMPLYAIRTAMSQANVEPNKMISIIEKGGVTLQEIMSRELTNAGQMVRRERDMSDVLTDWKTIDDVETVKRARENYDKTIAAFNAIIKFQEDYVKPMIDSLDQELAIMAESAGVKRGTDKMGVDNVPFASKTYNYTKQLMLALKVDAIADEVEKEINAGRHPVIALESTMESSIKDYAAGETIDEPTFSASLLKGLDSVMQYTIKDEDGNEQHLHYSPSELGEAGEKAYYELQNLIRESTSDIFISPLDAIIDRLHEKGYKVGELTGRNMYVERGEDGMVVVKRRTDKDKKRMQREFNNGELDVLILNKSASTGISLHASEKFSDQRQRSMIIAQPLSDINDYMQMIGRIDRTGQVHRGYYINLGLPVPAENRFLMMLSTKLKSLNANTTTSQDSESNEVDAPDLLNKYGSQVVVEYLRDNPEIYEKMGAPLKKGGLGGGKVMAKDLDEYKAQEDDARKITGYVALLSTKEQEDFYDDVVRRYNELIKYLNDTGNNDLKITVMPLRAKTIDKRVSSAGIDPNGSNPFAQNSYVEKVEMDVLRKPMKADEVRKTIEQVNKGESPEDYMHHVVATINAEDAARLAAEDARYEKDQQRAQESIAKQAEKINAQKKRTAEEKVSAIATFTEETNANTEAKHKQNVERIKSNSRMLKHSLNQFEVGKSYLVPDNLESQMFDFAASAIFCGYKTKDSKITASTTLAVFATLDGRRRVEVKLSQLGALQSIDKMTNDNWDSARSTTLDNWDSQIPTETRKEGYIMTGNILQAIADTQDERGGYPGQLISYTDINGNVHDGILMPDKWNSSMLKSSGAPIISRMQQIKDYETVTSHDKKVELSGNKWVNAYYLTVPKTKKDGAVYFENKTLLDAAGGNFYPYRGKLRADISGRDIEKVVMELSKLGVKVQDDSSSSDEGKKFRLLDADDPKAMELEALPDSELVPVYRNVQAFEDDALGSPMAFTDAETGERRTLEGRRWNYSAPPKVELTEEQQRKLDELNKNGYIMVDGKKSTELQINDGLKFVKPKTKEAQLQYFLKKNPEDKGLWAAYDPYDHAIETPLNTQFGEAYKRPNLVVVRSLIPKSEIDEPFHADYALLPTGAHQWNNGRTLFLSRWSKIDKVLTREEEAKLIDEYWKKHPGKREELKSHRDYNRFVPQVRRELEKMGYRFELDGKELTPEESLALDKQNWESRDIIPGREGHTPFVSNEDIARINAKMAGKWVGEPKEAMESAMSERVTELSERLHTPVRIIRTEEEVAALPSVRQRRMKGSFNPMTGEVTIVVPNNANMADIENTFVHEVVGHDGLRVLFPDEAKLNNALDELYRVSKDEIRGTIDRMAQKMYDAEVDRIREKKRKEHVANGEDANASYYADMAAAHAEAGKKREQFKRDATEEYGADLAGRIGEKGFEKMSAEELTFWGKLKAMLQKALQKLLDGLKIPGKRKWGDKDWAFVLHEAYKRKKNGGKPTVFDAADTEVMRRKTGFGDTKFSDGKREQQTANERFNNELTRYQNGEMDKNEMLHLGRPQGVMRTFLPNLPIVMRQRVIKKGSEKKHEVDVSAIMNMPQHLSSPIFVFQRSEDTIGVLTDMRDRNGKNVCVAIELKRQIQHGAKYLEVNDVRSFHGREFKNIVEPIANNRTLKWVDKEKGLAYLSSASQPVQQEIDKQVLNTATKVVKDFVNPKVSDENVADEGVMFRDGDMGLEETITKMKVEASQANADNWQTKQDAMRAIGGNLNKLRQAMARQRAYDLSTVKSITDLAKVLLENGLLDDLSKYETKRILSAVNNVHGKQDVSDYVQKVMDIMVDNQLRMGANQLGKLLSIRGSRVDARGIEVQGQLDPEGQRIAQVVRKATSLPKENIEERIADCTNRMGSDDNAVAEEAAIEYSGLLLAHQFVEDITESKAEEKALRESIKEAKADLDAGTMEADAYREYVESTNDAIRQNKIERAEAYRSIVEQVGGVLGGSVERAKAWREAEKQRVETIHHNANSDMTGRPNDEHHKESKAQKIANNSIVRFVLAPLGTFDQMLRMFGKKSVNGEGYLWNRYMRGWVEATEKEYTGYQNALKTLDEKVSEVFGKKMKWGDLFSLERNLPKATVTFWDGGEQKAHELTQGNLLYIYMVDKMADGRMKLRRMGITEEDVENIKEFVDPRFLELADWMQDEFLVEKRNEYNEVHKRMFGASMAAIENYFPLKILANARIEEVDVADDTTDTALPATSTGSIIKRRRNNLALDVMGADAFSVILDHIQQMERWASFAEFNRDLNTLLSYKRFRNQVMNMTSVYGGGKTLWKNFRNVCSMAAGAYRPPIAQLDKAAVNIAKGVTAAKVSFRVFTALKQFASMPAYLSDSSPVYLAANLVNPIGAWKWSMENLPLFEKRWKSRMAGDPRLMKSEMDWKMWQNHVVEIASRIGMSPNAFVDALTVAIGAHSMYQTKKKKYLRYGYDEETAEKRAKQDATILFNQTQQSSESAFLSTMQVDRSWLSVLFTIFRNASMAYERRLHNAFRNVKRHLFEPGYKAESIAFMAKQMRRDGIAPDKADANAKREYRKSLLHDLADIAIFGYGMQLAWNIFSYLPYLIFGDDDETKDEFWHDVFNHTMFGSIEGLTGGDVMSSAGQMALNGEANWSYLVKDMPLASDLATILQKMPKDKVAAMNDVVNLLVQSGVGVNPQSLTDAMVAIMDYCGDDANTSRECALLITRIINCPQSQIDKIYFDELNATAAEAQGMTPAEIAERYARYKMHRGAPLTGWAYTDEARDSVMTAQQNRVLTKAKEKLNNRMETEETKQLLSDYDAIAKQETALSKIKKTDHAAYREGMKQLRQSNDMRQHMRLKRYKHDMKELTAKYLRSKSAEERDSIVSTMFSTRAKMLEDIGRMKQQ
jgi:PAS domain-containing protein